MFREGTDFTVLDRSRGEWGEAADDITAMAMNYIFYSVQKSLRLTGDLKDLFELFFENYLEKSGDEELLEVIAPFFAFRATGCGQPHLVPPALRRCAQNALQFPGERPWLPRSSTTGM